MIIKRMWANGPLREWSGKRERRGQSAFCGGGFAGQYICDEGQHPTIGLYRVNVGQQNGQRWLCSEHKNKSRSKKEQPKALRQYHAAKQANA